MKACCFSRKTAVLFFAACVVSLPAQALLLDKEIARMPKDKRPSPEKIAAEEKIHEHWVEYQAQLQQRLEPQLAEWAKQGKPYLPNAIFPTDLPQANIPAFPGAEGAGRNSFGGRGGKVYVVTNLSDGGPGSFREACESAGPRIVIFNVAGIIHLKQPLHILAPYITIDGHTAPGDGVCIAGYSTLVDTHDVVIRYMRFRRGATNLFDRDDCLGGDPVGNVIVDHCSCSWGLDENLSMYRHKVYPKDFYPAGSPHFLKCPTLNITIQYCISSEALNTYGHAFGGTWGGCNTSFHHNLFACNTGRNPSIGMSYDFNFVNNVLFNWHHRTLDGGDQGSRVNCFNNYFEPGPDTLPSVNHRIGKPQPSTFRPDPTHRYGKWYVAGNIVAGAPAVTENNWNGGIEFDVEGARRESSTAVANRVQQLIAEVRADRPFSMAPVKIESAAAAYEDVLNHAGATLPDRDSVDQRAVRQAQIGKVDYVAGKGIITDVSQVGGYPKYIGKPIKDLCADGIPLSWKLKYGLHTNDVKLAQEDLQGDGYTVMDKYLDGLDPTRKIDWNDPASYVNTLGQSD